MSGDAQTQGEGGPVLAAVRAVAAAGRDGVPGPAAASGRWWVAFSGGVDSTVLLDAAVRVLRDAAPRRLAAVHVNHGLHPHADAWEAHCRAVAERLGVAIAVRRVTMEAPEGRGGLEAVARAARYAAFREAASRGDTLLLAHHRDDQAETVLLRILRGAGLAGVAAMRSDVVLDGLRVVRPLLAVSRAEILDYARGRGLRWVEDPANLDPVHHRNHVRREVLPAIGARWPGAAATLVRFAEQAGEAAALLDDLAALDLAAARGRTRHTLQASVVAALTPARAANALRAWLAACHGGAPPPRRWLRSLAAEVAGAAPDRIPEAVRGGIWVRRYRGDLYTGRVEDRPRVPSFIPWRLDGALDLPHGRLTADLTEGAGGAGAAGGRGGEGEGEGGEEDGSRVAGHTEEEGQGPGVRLAVARLPPTVEVRFRRGGERCRPAGRGITKPLKDLLRELGVPPWERDSLPLVFAGDRLAAVPDLFACEPFEARANEPAWRVAWTPRQTRLPGRSAGR